MFLHDSLSGLSSDVERLNGECSKKYVSFYSADFKLIGLLFKPGRSLLNKKGYQEINLLVRIHLSSRSPDLSLERANAIQDGSKSIKKPAEWTDPTPVDKFCPHDEACSKASGLTPPR